MIDPAKELMSLRDLIESLDKQLITLLSTRLSLSKDFAEIKNNLGLPTKDTDREIILHQLYEHWAKERDVEPKLVYKIFDLILKASKIRQKDFLRQKELLNHKTFRERVNDETDETEDKDVGKWIDNWKKSNSELSLQEYLGFSNKEYMEIVVLFK